MRLPPLNAIRAFEAAARHEGFIAASEELNVTRGAVSRHVKLLEAHLGVALFIRQAQGVRLTNAGKRLLPVITEAFRKISLEAERIKADANDLRIICPPATSIRWLIPKLADFRLRYPDIRVRLTTDFHGDIGYEEREYDLGFSVADWPNRSKETEMAVLFPVRLTPACAPDLLEQEGPFTDVLQLSRCELLHETPKREDWRRWIEAFAVQGLALGSGQDFPNLDIATRAAMVGAGFVMADLVLCREELESGALVAPFPDMVCDGPYGGVCLLGARDRWHEPKIEAFAAWAQEMAAKETCGWRI